MTDWLGKPYYSLDAYLKKTFGEKVYKLSLDGGMTCPNRDGTCGDRGCIFCSAGGSGDFAGDRNKSIPLLFIPSVMVTFECVGTVSNRDTSKASSFGASFFTVSFNTSTFFSGTLVPTICTKSFTFTAEI